MTHNTRSGQKLTNISGKHQHNFVTTSNLASCTKLNLNYIQQEEANVLLKPRVLSFIQLWA